MSNEAVAPPPPARMNGIHPAVKPVAAEVPAAAVPAPSNPETDRVRFANYVNSAGGPMLFIPSGEFTIGSEAMDAAPNERPLTKVTLSKFYVSRFPVTNAEYE